MRSVVLGLAVLALVLCASATVTFPDQYLVAGTFSIPYFNITEPLRVVFDAKNHRERIDYYHGMDSFFYTATTNYEVVPRINQRICLQNPAGADDLVRVIPDLSDWQQMGNVVVRNRMCNHFQKVVKDLNKTSTYDFYVAADGDQAPVQLVMNGYNFVWGSHPDVYILDYEVYVPNYDNDHEFELPKLCKTARQGTGQSARRSAHLLRGLLPYERDMERLFAHHKRRFNRQYDEEEHARRLEIFSRNQRFIDEYNMRRAPVTGVTLAMNQFGDLEHHEYRRTMLPSRGRRQRHPTAALHTAPARLPASGIDWRQLGGTNPPKDQGACGSCWTFGTTGTLEGAYFAKHGVLPSLSEQQVVDCAWGDRYLGSMGCDGGQTAGALQWVIDNGGIATESSYRYLMQDGYCHNDTSSGVRVLSYVNVTEGDENALASALLLMPVSVAIDAAHEEFEYYSSGVLRIDSCKNDFNDLDHEVLAVGFGTTEDGQDYWIVKNSWSTHWGDNGFVLMARNAGNMCGIATDAVYPIVA